VSNLKFQYSGYCGVLQKGFNKNFDINNYYGLEGLMGMIYCIQFSEIEE